MITAVSPSRFLGANRIADSNPKFPARSPRSLRIAASAHVPAAERSSFSSSSLYDVLGIPIGASTADVKAAYRRLARTCHPDVGAADSSAEEFMRIHSAYSTLSDPRKRAEYDRTALIRRRFSSSPTYSRRTWETDQCW